MFVLKNLLLLFAMAVMILSLWPVKRLISELPAGNMRRWWGALRILVLLFICGYFAYTVSYFDSYRGSVDFIVPGIFFFGAVFVFLVTSLSLQTSNAIKRNCELEHECITDPLMEVCNRRYMKIRLQGEFQRAKRYKEPLSIIMLDVDYFKKVNDGWGHQVGDLVLKRLAELIVATVRDSDVVCRYGGEELLVILPHTETAAALIVAENLRLKIANADIIMETADKPSQAIRVTVSLGVSSVCPEIDSVHSLLGQADKALYFAKKNGRNRTMSCSDLEEPERCVKR
ncbi:diguanylate cyclase (GGDEF) domain-containing protein [Desulfuromusa kysingii]|uniref:diguanylate cyclase n=1 Tax=Desulfuromusa kysingii TaxID=37625 RepID=A0A1H3XM34_9BACT|nr:GGDEF domain-containing protein [Desulfuromusa kysingii]SDZ99991.1 diguanylate cyclase (GGDEF) domain-containing protein [Desulfuromusa kysingii]